MSAKLSQEEKDRREIMIREALSRNPTLTKGHFWKCFGYSYELMNEFEKNGIKFGKAKKPYSGWKIKNAYSDGI